MTKVIALSLNKTPTFLSDKPFKWTGYVGLETEKGHFKVELKDEEANKLIEGVNGLIDSIVKSRGLG